MVRMLNAARFVVVTSIVGSILGLGACNPPPVNGGEGEGEGEGDVVAEGEGDVVAEGEGDGSTEGEGDTAEGEGDGVVSGEGEGDVGGSCTSDAGCGGSDVCNFADPNNDNFILDGACGPAPAGDDTGAACTAGQGNCARGLCISNRCSELCTVNGDCATGQACSSQSFTLDNGKGGLAGVCVADNNLPVTTCNHDADCTATGRLCNTLNDQDQLICGAPGGGAALEGACSSPFFENRAVCQTGLCDGAAGMCTRSCTTNGDCGGNLICSGSPFLIVGGDYCAEPCSVNADCNLGSAGRTCSIRDNQAENGVNTVCVDPPGTKTLGQPSVDGLDCTTGLQFGGQCTQLCQPGGGCAAPMPNCTSVNLQLPNGGTQPVNLCIP